VDAKFNKANDKFVESYEVKGSPASQKVKDFMISLNNDLEKIFFLSQQADSLTRSATIPDSLMNSIIDERAAIANNITRSFNEAISRSDNPALSMFILGYYQSTANNPDFHIQPLSNEEVSTMVNGIAAKYPAHTGVATVKRSLDEQLQKSQGLVGKQAPEFALPDVNGKEIKLSSFRGKYLLIDFWASWCKPCRIENPNVVKAYGKYRNKNFEILGVSLDRPGGKDEWIKAIKHDNLSWPQVSDLSFWDSPVVPLYGVEGIPFNVLLDPQGKVISQGLHGEQLEAKLSEVLK
jgi:peroxiredoxin